MVVIYCYLEKQKYKVKKFHVHNSSYFEISASFFYVLPSNKRRILKFRN